MIRQQWIVVFLLVLMVAAAAAAAAAAGDIFDQKSIDIPSLASSASASASSSLLLPRIVGGVVANPTLYPFYAYLEIRSGTGARACGGTLVAPDIVLTAAHCFDVTVLSVKVLINNTSLTQSTGFEYLRAGESWTIHPEYEINTFANDVAILLLETPVPPQVTPISLNANSALPQDDDALQVIGLGLTTENGNFPTNLQMASLQSINVDACANSYAAAPQGFIPVSEDLQLCASASGQDSCQGDSGGPLLLPNNDNDGASSFTQVGLVSFGLGCAIEVRLS